MDPKLKNRPHRWFILTTTSPALALLKFIVHLTFKGKKAVSLSDLLVRWSLRAWVKKTLVFLWQMARTWSGQNVTSKPRCLHESFWNVSIHTLTMCIKGDFSWNSGLRLHRLVAFCPDELQAMREKHTFSLVTLSFNVRRLISQLEWLF